MVGPLIDHQFSLGDNHFFTRGLIPNVCDKVDVLLSQLVMKISSRHSLLFLLSSFCV